MSMNHGKLLGTLGAILTALLTAQASGAAGIEVIPAFGWLLIGAINAGVGYLAGMSQPK